MTNEGHLKVDHNYYYHVQGEMAIKGCKWAHLVTWTNAPENNLHMQKIEFNQELWDSVILPNLEKFYIDVLVPEILLRRIQLSINI